MTLIKNCAYNTGVMNNTPNTPKIPLPSMADLALGTPDGFVNMPCSNTLNCPPRESVKITSVDTDEFRDMLPTSEEFYADAKAEFGEMVEPEDWTQACGPDRGSRIDGVGQEYPF